MRHNMKNLETIEMSTYYGVIMNVKYFFNCKKRRISKIRYPSNLISNYKKKKRKDTK